MHNNQTHCICTCTHIDRIIICHRKAHCGHKRHMYKVAAVVVSLPTSGCGSQTVNLTFFAYTLNLTNRIKQDVGDELVHVCNDRLVYEHLQEMHIVAGERFIPYRIISIIVNSISQRLSRSLNLMINSRNSTKLSPQFQSSLVILWHGRRGERIIVIRQGRIFDMLLLLCSGGCDEDRTYVHLV